MKDLDQLSEKLKAVAENRQACLKQCKTMLAGFKALGEQNMDYMDGHMDALWDVMEAGDETEILYRDYLAYVSSFNPKISGERMRNLEEHLGYWTPVAIAAAFVARELHKGQKDKGGNDYFTSHLLPVGNRGFTWKEMAVGYLHDAAEDTSYREDEVVDAVRSRLDAMADGKSKAWMDEFDIMPYPNGSIFFPSEEDWNEVKAALQTLNHRNSDNIFAYMEKIKRNGLALRVKLHVLRSNMDLSRIPQPTNADLERLEWYKEEYYELLEALNEMESGAME